MYKGGLQWGIYSSYFQSNDRDQLFDHLIDMSVIIYDITQDSTQVKSIVFK